MRKRVKLIVGAADLPKKICHHMVGEDHTPIHRMSVGAVIMVIGVSIAKVDASGMYHVFHYAFDVVGYVLHGLGTVPFINSLIQDEHRE
jgi:hypothetical protein